ncbi:hypothetical protein [Streptomyces sp. 142MFCol3.1]|uniref:hypothetical protein n=1 Tax=Streptomyces sp. 142MFCol3.1 TaxID=1172179 RepID=UPI0003F9ABF2|nr:hypothetical protein [Streptomyces sp. 142MFCol3.1]
MAFLTHELLVEPCRELATVVLTDVAPHAYVEVYGIRGCEAYEKRKSVKQAHYQRQGAELIEWEVGQPMPDLTLGRLYRRPC